MERFDLLGMLSYFSLQCGVHSPEALVALAARMGASSVGIWDKGNIYGLIRGLVAARDQGIKALCGVRFDLEDGRGLLAVCLDRQGYVLLCNLLSRDVPDILAEFVSGGWRGLALIALDRKSLARLYAARLEVSSSDLNDQLLYAGLAFGTPYHGMRQDANRLGVPCVACLNGGIWINQDDAPLVELLQAFSRRVTLTADRQGFVLPGYGQIPDRVQYKNAWQACPQAIEEAQALVARCQDLDLLPSSPVLPDFNRMGQRQAFDYLLQLCVQGAERRKIDLPDINALHQAALGNGNFEGTNIYAARLVKELRLIISKGYVAYFLIVHDIVKQCPRTCGRGSAASSLVSYLLAITHVDPLEHDLLFDRFLHEERQDPPDIDVDFPWDERRRVLDYVFERYKGRVGMVADHVTYAWRSSIRETARAFGCGEMQIGEWIAACEQGAAEKVPPYIMGLAARLEGLPRYIGTHPGGVVITPGPINWYTTVQASAAGLPLIAWEKDATEMAGLVKIDLLGNRSLAVLRDSISLIERHHGQQIVWEDFNPINDGQVREMIEAGDTLGVFYIESPATRQLLQKMGNGSFRHVVAASSLIRPAANRWINEYVDRLHGKSWRLAAPADEVLKETLGIMAYQEDVMRIAVHCAGFSPRQADELRRILGKKAAGLRLEDARERFTSGCVLNGMSTADAADLWEMVHSFAGYSFCKAHSASYAMVSYRLAWVKRYYPHVFFTAVINNGGGFYAAQTYLNAARCRGIGVKKPDVNQSGMGCTVHGKAILLGLGQLQHVPGAFIERLLIERRERGGFSSFADFISRLSPSLVELRQFIRSGACDCIACGLTRPQLFWQYARTLVEKNQARLFDDSPPPLPVGDYAPEQKMRDEYESLGLHIDRHPVIVQRLHLLRLLGSQSRLINSTKIAACVDRRIVIAGILVAYKKVRTRNRLDMQFLTFEDEFGLFEAVMFPDVYRHWIGRLHWGVAYGVKAMVLEDRSAISLQINSMIDLSLQEN